MSQRANFRVIDFGDHYSIEKCQMENGKIISHTSNKSLFVIYKKKDMTDYQIQFRNYLTQLSIGVNQPCIEPIVVAKEKINEKSTKNSVQPGKKRGSSSKK